MNKTLGKEGVDKQEEEWANSSGTPRSNLESSTTDGTTGLATNVQERKLLFQKCQNDEDTTNSTSFDNGTGPGTSKPSVSGATSSQSLEENGTVSAKSGSENHATRCRVCESTASLQKFKKSSFRPKGRSQAVWIYRLRCDSRQCGESFGPYYRFDSTNILEVNEDGRPLLDDKEAQAKKEENDVKNLIQSPPANENLKEVDGVVYTSEVDMSCGVKLRIQKRSLPSVPSKENIEKMETAPESEEGVSFAEEPSVMQVDEQVGETELQLGNVSQTIRGQRGRRRGTKIIRGRARLRVKNSAAQLEIAAKTAREETPPPPPPTLRPREPASASKRKVGRSGKCNSGLKRAHPDTKSNASNNLSHSTAPAKRGRGQVHLAVHSLPILDLPLINMQKSMPVEKVRRTVETQTGCDVHVVTTILDEMLVSHFKKDFKCDPRGTTEADGQSFAIPKTLYRRMLVQCKLMKAKEKENARLKSENERLLKQAPEITATFRNFRQICGDSLGRLQGDVIALQDEFKHHEIEMTAETKKTSIKLKDYEKRVEESRNVLKSQKDALEATLNMRNKELEYERKRVEFYQRAREVHDRVAQQAVGVQEELQKKLTDTLYIAENARCAHCQSTDRVWKTMTQESADLKHSLQKACMKRDEFQFRLTKTEKINATLSKDVDRLNYEVRTYKAMLEKNKEKEQHNSRKEMMAINEKKARAIAQPQFQPSPPSVPPMHTKSSSCAYTPNSVEHERDKTGLESPASLALEKPPETETTPVPAVAAEQSAQTVPSSPSMLSSESDLELSRLPPPPPPPKDVGIAPQFARWIKKAEEEQSKDSSPFETNSQKLAGIFNLPTNHLKDSLNKCVSPAQGRDFARREGTPKLDKTLPGRQERERSTHSQGACTPAGGEWGDDQARIEPKLAIEMAEFFGAAPSADNLVRKTQSPLLATPRLEPKPTPSGAPKVATTREERKPIAEVTTKVARLQQGELLRDSTPVRKFLTEVPEIEKAPAGRTPNSDDPNTPKDEVLEDEADPSGDELSTAATSASEPMTSTNGQKTASGNSAPQNTIRSPPKKAKAKQGVAKQNGKKLNERSVKKIVRVGRGRPDDGPIDFFFNHPRPSVGHSNDDAGPLRGGLPPFRRPTTPPRLMERQLTGFSDLSPNQKLPDFRVWNGPAGARIPERPYSRPNPAMSRRSEEMFESSQTSWHSRAQFELEPRRSGPEPYGSWGGDDRNWGPDPMSRTWREPSGPGMGTGSGPGPRLAWDDRRSPPRQWDSQPRLPQVRGASWGEPARLEEWGSAPRGPPGPSRMGPAGIGPGPRGMDPTRRYWL